MKPYTGLVILFILALASFYFFGKQLVKDSKHHHKVIELKESILGRKVVLDKDTLTIMDYYRGYYLLSNNVKVREEIINELIIAK